MSKHKESRQLIRRLKRHGFTCEPTGPSNGAHWRLTAPDGETWTIGQTPSQTSITHALHWAHKHGLPR